MKLFRFKLFALAALVTPFTSVTLATLVTLAGTERLAMAAPNAESPIVLQVQSDDSTDAVQVRAALSAKLRATLVGPSDTEESRRLRQLFVRIDRTLVTVAYRDEQGREVTRTVQAANKAAVVEAVAILAENLITDQTGALIAQNTPATPATPETAPAPKPAAPAPVKRPTHFAVASLVYPVATNFGKPNVHTYFALDALYGRVGAVSGLQLSGLAGYVDGPVNGLQVSGVLGYAGEAVNGLQVNGLVGISGETVTGIQLAGTTAIAGQVRGLQIAGLVGTAPGGVDGLQLSPVAVTGDVQGLQLGVVDVARDMQGLQFGVVNVARNVKGLQFGVVNIADDVKGLQFGVFNYSRTGRIGAIAWASNHGLANAGIKFTTKYAYTVVRGTYSYERSTEFFGPGFNVGLHLPAFDPVFVDLDVGTTFLFRTSATGAQGFSDHQARVLVGANIGNNLSVFAGGGLSVQEDRKEPRDVTFHPVVSGGAQIMY